MKKESFYTHKSILASSVIAIPCDIIINTAPRLIQMSR